MAFLTISEAVTASTPDHRRSRFSLQIAYVVRVADVRDCPRVLTLVYRLVPVRRCQFSKQTTWYLSVRDRGSSS
jgi:hypothetical protein